MLAIRMTVLFANDHLQRNRGARRRPDDPDGHLQQSCSSIPLILVIWRTVLFANDHLQRKRGGQIIQMIICNNSCSSVPLILVIQSTICKGTEEHGGGRIIQMIICNNPCSSLPLILVIRWTVLFANDHLKKEMRNNCHDEQFL